MEKPASPVATSFNPYGAKWASGEETITEKTSGSSRLGGGVGWRGWEVFGGVFSTAPLRGLG